MEKHLNLGLDSKEHGKYSIDYSEIPYQIEAKCRYKFALKEDESRYNFLIKQNKLNGIATILVEKVIDLLHNNSNIIVMFPEEGPTIRINIESPISRTESTKPLLIDFSGDATCTRRDGLSEKETEQAEEFDSKCNKILIHASRKLVRRTFQHICLPEEGLAIGLELELYFENIELNLLFPFFSGRDLSRCRNTLFPI